MSFKNELRRESRKSCHKRSCPIKCATDVELDIDVKPHVRCQEICRRVPKFDVEIDFDIDHRCHIRPKKCKETRGCKTGCIFEVSFDFECNSKVLRHPCDKAHALYKLDVELEASPKCKPLDGCKSKHRRD
jgi:hypothetical protein